MTRILLGFNGNCFTNRFDEPEEWTALCADLGIRHVMFNVDLIDPYWPWDIQHRLCDRTLEACRKHGVTIHCSFGGHHNHQHYLGHFDPEVRRESERWYRSAIRQTGYLGGRSFGTCFAIQTVACDRDAMRRRQIMDEAVATYHRLAEYAAEVGLEALAYEMTSVRRETCATFAENDEMLQRCSDMAVPMRVCLDLGHRNLAGTPEEANHLSWISRYGRQCDVIDCQQTDRAGSRHWPFTPEFNSKGIIRGDEVVAAIHASGAARVLLAFELRTAAYHPQEGTHIDSLRQSVEYWRAWIKE
jgi:D-erythrulose 1-phosphate 3-epimerase